MNLDPHVNLDSGVRPEAGQPEVTPQTVTTCFGCGADNRGGLQLHTHTEADQSTRIMTTVAERFSGEPGIVHGGIQATILDEVMGRAVNRAIPAEHEDCPAVTATFEIRYRQPCLTETQLIARGRVVSIAWPSILVEGSISDPTGVVLTEAKARWRVLETRVERSVPRHI